MADRGKSVSRKINTHLVHIAKRRDTAGKGVSTKLVGLQIKLVEEYMQDPDLTAF